MEKVMYNGEEIEITTKLDDGEIEMRELEDNKDLDDTIDLSDVLDKTQEIDWSNNE